MEERAAVGVRRIADVADRRDLIVVGGVLAADHVDRDVADLVVVPRLHRRRAWR